MNARNLAAKLAVVTLPLAACSGGGETLPPESTIQEILVDTESEQQATLARELALSDWLTAQSLGIVARSDIRELHFGRNIHKDALTGTATQLGRVDVYADITDDSVEYDASEFTLDWGRQCDVAAGTLALVGDTNRDDILAVILDSGHFSTCEPGSVVSIQLSAPWQKTSAVYPHPDTDSYELNQILDIPHIYTSSDETTLTTIPGVVEFPDLEYPETSTTSLPPDGEITHTHEHTHGPDCSCAHEDDSDTISD